jgi:hypothetical protein
MPTGRGNRIRFSLRRKSDVIWMLRFVCWQVRDEGALSVALYRESRFTFCPQADLRIVANRPRFGCLGEIRGAYKSQREPRGA